MLKHPLKTTKPVRIKVFHGHGKNRTETIEERVIYKWAWPPGLSRCRVSGFRHYDKRMRKLMHKQRKRRK